MNADGLIYNYLVLHSPFTYDQNHYSPTLVILAIAPKKYIVFCRQYDNGGYVKETKIQQYKATIHEKPLYYPVSKHFNLLGYTQDNIKCFLVTTEFCFVHISWKQEIKWINKLHTHEQKFRYVFFLQGYRYFSHK